MKKQCAWTPNKNQIESSNLFAFLQYVNRVHNLNLKNYEQLYDFSIKEKPKFWSNIWDFTNIIGHKGNVIVKNENSFENVQWFSDAKLNYAENLLAHPTNEIAVVSNTEHQFFSSLTYADLYDQVSQCVQFFQTIGLKKGDRVALFVDNTPQTLVCVLAASALGAISSLCSTDFGAEGAISRFAQIEPKILIYSERSYYNGKIHDQNQKIIQISNSIKSVKEILCLNINNSRKDNENFKTHYFSDLLKNFSPNKIVFEQVEFSHPLYIAYSSGTTGIPKCIVHGHGGVLLQHKKEHILHCDIKLNDKVFYYTTCGWMMWQWLISALGCKASIVLYQGSPFYPDSKLLLKYLDHENITFFGTSAKYIDILRKENIAIGKEFEFKKLRMIGSTGSPLIAENFDYIYKNWKSDVCVASLSGGTDILSCFVLGCPIKPVVSGEIQCRGLGMQVEVWNENEEPVVDTAGELVCTAPFPSMPVFFWNDFDGLKYKQTYFEKYKNVWWHGDWAMLTSDEGCIIYGRSDTTLNPDGIRIGTAEIYRQVEQFDEIMESVITEYCVLGNSRIVLFVKLKDSFCLNENLIHAIKQKIKLNCSPRHVPALILQVLDIPKTKSGKLMELAVKNMINNRGIPNIDSIQNPDSLEYFKNIIPLNF